jgi:hypothetical protein
MRLSAYMSNTFGLDMAYVLVIVFEHGLRWGRTRIKMGKNSVTWGMSMSLWYDIVDVTLFSF